MNVGRLTTIKHLEHSHVHLLELAYFIMFSYILPVHNSKATYIEYLISFNPMDNVIKYEVEIIPRIARNELKVREGSFVASKEDIDNLFNILSKIRNSTIFEIGNLMYGSPSDFYYDIYEEDRVKSLTEKCSTLIKGINWIC